VIGDPDRGSRLLASLREQLGVVPGYLVVYDTRGAVRFISNDVVRLSQDDSARFYSAITALLNGQSAGVIKLSLDRVILVALAVQGRTTELNRVAAGLRVTDIDEWPPQLTTTVLIVVPVVVALSAWGAWLLLATLSTRLGRIRREVADITDGRSLHRRLSADDAEPELVSLIATVNAMIARLESSFMALRRFTADASHELKTPLTVLRATVERAMNDATKEEGDALIPLEEALHEITRMTDLVNSLLTLARADEGRFDLHREPVDLSALVQEVYETALILGEAAGIEVTLPFTTEVTVMGDRTRLRQLFLNLITNAIKYTAPGGRVDLGLGRHPDNVTFAVRDTGVGISAADLPNIFERFYRADQVRSRTSERGGFGLGLAISQWIAQAHGGTLTVSSRLGKGSLFTVTLPLAPPQGASKGEFINS